LALYQERCEPVYRRVVTDVLSYLYEQAKRTEEGGISHLGSSEFFTPTLWVDSLFMFGNVLTRWGVAENDERALDEYQSQFLIFADLLQDETGWFRHSIYWDLPHEDVYWARGNAWVTAATAEYLRARSERGESAPAVQAAWQAQVDAVLTSQDAPSGMWWTVLDRPGETYLETSATALFALGLARGYRDGLFDERVLGSIGNAINGVRAQIIDDDQGRPVVTGISGPTTVGTFERYAEVALDEDIHYGVGAVILALLEVSNLTP
jgi:unsaturated rhamnogalacturonyl hydrolase